MNPIVHADHEAMSRAAADWLAARITAKPDSLICMATGATPMRCYELLAARGPFDKLRVLKLDEWGGIPMSSPATCEIFLRKTFVEPLGLQNRYTGFESQPNDPGMECARIEKWLRENGPIDLCVLGLGINGHLGFNEPADELQPHAHIAKLSSESLNHSMVAGLQQRPTFGLTLGMADLLHSREILLVVSDASKKSPMQRLLFGGISARFPATFLRLHRRITILCDEAAWTSPS